MYLVQELFEKINSNQLLHMYTINCTCTRSVYYFMQPKILCTRMTQVNDLFMMIPFKTNDNLGNKKEFHRNECNI